MALPLSLHAKRVANIARQCLPPSLLSWNLCRDKGGIDQGVECVLAHAIPTAFSFVRQCYCFQRACLDPTANRRIVDTEMPSDFVYCQQFVSGVRLASICALA